MRLSAGLPRVAHHSFRSAHTIANTVLVPMLAKGGDRVGGRGRVPRHEGTGIRRRPYCDYLIFYRVGAERIDVLHVLNGAQDCEVILFPTD